MNIVSYNEIYCLRFIVSDCGKGGDYGRLGIFPTLNVGLMTLLNFQPFELTERQKKVHKFIV